MKEKITESLSNSAISYLTNGLNLFHAVRNLNENFQVSIGNISISIELILKTIIAENCFPFLFTNLPLDLKLKLTYPEIAKNKSIPNLIIKDIEAFSFNSVKMDDCISIFYILFPDKKQDYKSFFRFLSNTRNVVVHGVIPNYKKYELEKLAYFSIDLIKFLQKQKKSAFKRHKFSRLDELFYKNYDNVVIDRVEKAIEKAKNKLNTTEESLFLFREESWNTFLCKCPICSSEVILNGYTDYHFEKLDDREGDFAVLQFFADSFSCNECGLELLDTKEMKLAGVETIYFRPDDEIEPFMEHQIKLIEGD